MIHDVDQEIDVFWEPFEEVKFRTDMYIVSEISIMFYQTMGKSEFEITNLNIYYDEFYFGRILSKKARNNIALRKEIQK